MVSPVCVRNVIQPERVSEEMRCREVWCCLWVVTLSLSERRWTAYDFLGAIHRWAVKRGCDILSGNNDNNNDDGGDDGCCLLGAYHLPGLTLVLHTHNLT